MRISDWSSDVCSSDLLETAAGDRLEDVLADHALVARIVGVHRDRHVGEHRFGAGVRGAHMVPPILGCVAVVGRIIFVLDAALHTVGLYTESRNRGLLDRERKQLKTTQLTALSMTRFVLA